MTLEGTAGNCSVSYLLRSSLSLLPSCGLASGKATVLHATLESLPEQLREEVNNHVPHLNTPVTLCQCT